MADQFRQADFTFHAHMYPFEFHTNKRNVKVSLGYDNRYDIYKNKCSPVDHSFSVASFKLTLLFKVVWRWNSLSLMTVVCSEVIVMQK